MALELQQTELDVPPHSYRLALPSDWGAFLEQTAKEYVALRTATVEQLRALSLDDVEILDVAGVAQRLAAAAIPPWNGGNLDVLRSDFGETIAFLIAEELYQTIFTYKSVRDRETTTLPGRGIDAVGVEGVNGLRLVLGETKVSDEAQSPPQVVDRSSDSLRKQHGHHLSQRKDTADKIWNLARHARDDEARDMLLRAAFLFEQNDARLSIVCYCLLVRSAVTCCVPEDFGSFHKQPQSLNPASIRFYILKTPCPIEEAVSQWQLCIQREAGGDA